MSREQLPRNLEAELSRAAAAAGTIAVEATKPTAEQQRVFWQVESQLGGSIDKQDLYYGALDITARSDQLLYFGLRPLHPKAVEELSIFKLSKELAEHGVEESKIIQRSGMKLAQFIDIQNEPLRALIKLKDKTAGTPFENFMIFLSQFEDEHKIYQLRRIYFSAK